MEVGRALGLQWDLVGRSVQSVMLHAMRLRLALVVLTAPVLTALGPTGARRRDRVWLTRHIMHTHAR